MIKLFNKKFLFAYLIIVIGAIFCFLRSLFFEPIEDEMVYRFILDDGFGSYHEHPIRNIWDVLVSQSHMYMSHSGRFLVHTITQIFAALLGREWFSICNSLTFILVAAMLLNFVKQKESKSSYYTIFAIAIVIVISCFYPGGGYRWIAISLNYFWPMPLILWFIFTLTEDHAKSNPFKNIIIGGLAGFTQEVFILPLCLVTFIMICHRLYTKQKSSVAFYCLILSFWIGAAILILAPGNFVRAAHEPGAGVSIIKTWDGIKGICFNKFFIITLAIIIFELLRYKGLRRFWAQYNFTFACFITSLLITIPVHSTSFSYTGCGFFAILLLLKIASNYANRISRKSAIFVYTISVISFVAFCIYQCVIINIDRQLEVINHKIVEDYKQSPDGVIEVKPLQIDNWIRPEVTDFYFLCGPQNPIGLWLRYTLQLVHGNEEKIMTLLKPDEYKKFEELPNFNESDYVPGNAGFIRIGPCLLLPLSKIPTDILSFEAEYYPQPDNTLRSLIKKFYKKPLYQSTAEFPIEDISILQTRKGDYLVIYDFTEAKIKSINYKR